MIKPPSTKPKSSPDLWKYNRLKRWRITAILETISPLHIGNGDFLTIDINNNEVDVNAFIKGNDNKPIIPGSTLKGNLRAYLAKNLEIDELDKLDLVFGKAFKNETDQGAGGLAEFHDAQLCRKSNSGSHFPDWDVNRQTYIEASTAIDRHTKVTLDGSLHYSECVAPGSRFEVIITGDMQEQGAALIVKVLQIFNDRNNTLHLGADIANAKGTMELLGAVKVEMLDNDTIIDWLTNKSTVAMASTKFRSLNKDEIDRLITKAPTFQVNKQNNSFDINLQFDGPFMVNDPSQQAPEIVEKSSNSQWPDHILLRDKDGKAVLPAKSFRGALRSQAERIIRTLGGQCCDNANPCKDNRKLCIACEMFGATGWKSTLNISSFSVVNSLPEKDQQFVAIDRFHGGGKEGALFSNTHVERPEFKGRLCLDIRSENKDALAWRKGLLALVFLDLKEGDITFGFGINKGYGKIEKAMISNEDSICQEDIKAFRLKCKSSSKIYSCNSSLVPPTVNNNINSSQSGVSTNNQKNQFHNPYHFVPVKEHGTESWLKKDELSTDNTHHSHAFYRDKDNEAKVLHHGRIICKLTSETPFFIGAKDDIQSDGEAKRKEPYQLNGQLAIPATSLRGMLSSLSETASNSALRVLENGLLSYRKAVNKALNRIGMIIKTDNAWQLIPMLSIGENTIKLSEVYSVHEMRDFLEDKFSWSPEHNVVYYHSPQSNSKCIPVSQYTSGMGCYILRVLGKDENRKKELENKKNELLVKVDERYVDTNNNIFDYQQFIDDNKNNSLHIPDEVISQYTELADQRSKSQKNNHDLKDDIDCCSTKWQPFHLKGASRKRVDQYCALALNDYDLVYFSTQSDNDNKVSEIAFSAIWRDKVENQVHAFFPVDLLPFNKDRTSVSPAELLFGFIESNDKKESRDHALAYAGKVRIGAGILSSANQDDELFCQEVTLKALSAPKPPSPALYFKARDNNNYISKADLNKNEHQSQGRKTYLHAKLLKNEVQKFTAKGIPANNKFVFYPWESHQPKEHEKLKVRIKPVQKGTSFYFQVDFDNLSDWELGLLCFALRPNDSFRHKLGMGKPIGLGSVRVDIAALQTMNRTLRYSDDAMEKPRYNAINWVNQNYQEELKKSYNVNCNELSERTPESFRDIFSSTMDSDIYQAIDLLGNPAHIQYPVHYPQVEGSSIEEENYKWFVANDIGSGRHKTPQQEVMSPITKNNTRIPTLTRHKWYET